MDNLFVQAVLIFLVTAFGGLNAVLASSQISRSIVIGPLVGLVLGDLQTGLVVGATLELVFLGAMAIGASNPPSGVPGTVLGTAYAITTGADLGAAVTLAIPVSMLMSFLWDVVVMTIVPLLGAKADKYAEEGDHKGVDRMHYLGLIVQRLCTPIFVTLAFCLGQTFIKTIVDNIPPFITNGFNYAMGIIPAIGFALIARMIITKQLAAFLFLGFVLAAFFKLSLIGITCIGVIIVALWAFNANSAIQKGAENGNEF
jgi:fructoselysine and glucoselysine-specific PTS system IIC component